MALSLRGCGLVGRGPVSSPVPEVAESAIEYTEHGTEHDSLSVKVTANTFEDEEYGRYQNAVPNRSDQHATVFHCVRTEVVKPSSTHLP